VSDKPYVRPSTYNDCFEMARHMREEDKEEVRILSGSSPLSALIDGFNISKKCWTVVYEGKPTAMFGVVAVKGEAALPWMLATDDLKSIKKSFLSQCKVYVQEMFEVSNSNTLFNICWSNNKVHVNWLKWLGFKFDMPSIIINEQVFLPFYKHKE